MDEIRERNALIHSRRYTPAQAIPKRAANPVAPERVRRADIRHTAHYPQRWQRVRPAAAPLQHAGSPTPSTHFLRLQPEKCQSVGKSGRRSSSRRVIQFGSLDSPPTVPPRRNIDDWHGFRRCSNVADEDGMPHATPARTRVVGTLRVCCILSATPSAMPRVTYGETWWRGGKFRGWLAPHALLWLSISPDSTPSLHRIFSGCILCRCINALVLHALVASRPVCSANSV